MLGIYPNTYWGEACFAFFLKFHQEWHALILLRQDLGKEFILSLFTLASDFFCRVIITVLQTSYINVLRVWLLLYNVIINLFVVLFYPKEINLLCKFHSDYCTICICNSLLELLLNFWFGRIEQHSFSFCSHLCCSSWGLGCGMGAFQHYQFSYIRSKIAIVVILICNRWVFLFDGNVYFM